MYNTNELIKIIQAAQQERGLNDIQFAKYIGIDKGGWSKIKRGIRPPGLVFFRAVSSKLPEVQLAVLQHLAKNEDS